jgi:hypothetical protein
MQKSESHLLPLKKCGQNADTEGKIRIPNSYRLAVWNSLLVPGAGFETAKTTKIQTIELHT